MDEKVILVAGGTGGIGSGLIRGLASSGAIVCFTYNRAEDVARSLEDGLGKYRIRSYRCDAQDRAQVKNTVRQIEEEFGKIDVLVNAFGITRDRTLVFMSDEDWDSVLSVNLNGVYAFTKATVTGMIKRRCGSIINYSSVTGISGMAGQTNYAASKAAIIGFSKSLAREVSPRGVRVNVIAPGFIKTAMTDALPPGYLEEMQKRILLGRVGEVDDLVGITRLLASEESSFITGQVFVVDGGMVL